MNVKLISFEVNIILSLKISVLLRLEKLAKSWQTLFDHYKGDENCKSLSISLKE
jgi:hypothetical protein